jgi:tetratricopeptide (TPR) repeat protein
VHDDATTLGSGRTTIGRAEPTLAGGAATVPDAVGEEPTLEEGASIGRYVLGRRLGAGGMGVVHAARDPDLDREIAIKLATLHRSTAVDQLVREARALAQVNHPNVVNVLDVGTTDDGSGAAARVFIAMELIDGVTLRAWCRQRARSWREIAAALVDAGRGLAAVHAAGLVHGDVKPDNVMVGRDGRVRLMDFGLAALVRERADTGRADAAWTGPAGTPLYMAPELLEGRPADRRSDQYAFFVGAWEALCGHPPFALDSLAELASAKLEGALREWPRASAVPRRAQAVVRRGLARAPESRFPEVADAIDALQRAATPRSGRPLALGLAALAAGATVWWSTRAPAVSCVQERVEWDAARSARVRDAFAATGVRHAHDSWQRVDALLGRWVEEWTRVRDEVCEGARRGEVAAAASLRCLARAGAELDELGRVLVDADAALVERAVVGASALPKPAACRHAQGDEAGLDERERELIARAEAAVARITALDRAYLMPQLREELAAVSEYLHELPDSAVRAELEIYIAREAGEHGETEVAREGYERAFLLAQRLGRHDLALRPAMRMMTLAGDEAGRALADAWIPRARELVERSGDVGDRARFHNQRVGGVRGGVVGARARFHNQLGIAIANRQDFVGAREEFAKAVELVPQDDAIDVMTYLGNLAAADMELGREYEGEVELRRVLEIGERVYGPEHPVLRGTLANLAIALTQQSRYVESLEVSERALRLVDRKNQPAAESVLRSTMANTLVELGQRARAEAEFHRAIELVDHPGLASYLPPPLTGLSHLLRESGRPREALDAANRARVALESTAGDDSRHLALPLLAAAQAHRELGEPDRARELAQDALRRALAHDSPMTLVAQAKLVLSRALWDAKRDRDRVRARQLAREALATFWATGAWERLRATAEVLREMGAPQD